VLPQEWLPLRVHSPTVTEKRLKESGVAGHIMRYL
jgi:hypothetical protein